MTNIRWRGNLKKTTINNLNKGAPMRLKLRFDLNENILPLSYRRSVMSFLKNAIADYNHEKFDDLYDPFECKSKSYVFAVALPPGSRFEKNQITLGDKSLSLCFSTYDMSDLILFYNAFLNQKKKAFDLPFGNNMVLKNIEMVNVQPVFKSEIKIKMLSPLVLRKHDREGKNDRYITYLDDEFNNLFIEVTANMLEKAGMKIDMQNMKIKPVNPKKTVISEFSIKFPVSIGTYTLEGPPELLTFLQSSGIGNRRNAGCGLFQVI